MLQNRNRLQEEIEADYSRSSSEGRRFVDVITIRQALQLRDAGMPEAQVEERLGMKKGTVRQFGPRGVFGVPDQRGDGWGGGAG